MSSLMSSRSGAGSQDTRRVADAALLCGAGIRDGGVSLRVRAPPRQEIYVVLDREANTRSHLSPMAISQGTRPPARAHSIASVSTLRPARGGRAHGPSQAVDPSAYSGMVMLWPGVRLKGRVVYGMRVGTFARRHLGRSG